METVASQHLKNDHATLSIMVFVQRYLIIGLSLALLATSIVVFFFIQQTTSVVTITRTEKGFEPASVNILRGQTVRFVSSVPDKNFWPASNEHPSHGLLPDFDPKRALESEEIFEYTFTKLGDWEFHDHLDSNVKGHVIVYSKHGQSSADCLDRSADKALTSQENCWIDEFKEVYEEQGLDSVFALFGEYLAQDEIFKRNCHDFMHLIGDMAYEEYKKTNLPIVNSATSYCGYGFYHGFIEQLIAETGDYTSAKYYCDLVSKDKRHLNKEFAGDAELACQHGFGHSVLDSLEGNFWGDPKLMINESLNRCQKIFSGGHPLYQCSTGVFNSLAIALDNNAYQISFSNLDEPYSICSWLDEVYRPACYIEIVIRYHTGKKTPTDEVIADILLLPDNNSIESTLTSFAADMVQYKLPYDFNLIKEFAEKCFAINDGKLQSKCMKGVHIGIWKTNSTFTNQAESKKLCDLYLDSNKKQVCEEAIINKNSVEEAW